MALTEEQREISRQISQQLWDSGIIDISNDTSELFAERFLAALPKPEVVARTIGADWISTGEGTWLGRIESHLPLKELTSLFIESPIAQPASAPSEQKPAAHLSEIYEQMETPFNKLLSAQQRHFLFENEYELKYLPIYADQPDPTYIVKWVWEVRDKHGASVAEAHEWMYQAINNAQVDAIASVKGGE